MIKIRELKTGKIYNQVSEFKFITKDWNNDNDIYTKDDILDNDEYEIYER